MRFIIINKVITIHNKLKLQFHGMNTLWRHLDAILIAQWQCPLQCHLTFDKGEWNYYLVRYVIWNGQMWTLVAVLSLSPLPRIMRRSSTVFSGFCVFVRDLNNTRHWTVYGLVTQPIELLSLWSQLLFDVVRWSFNGTTAISSQ